MFKKILSTSIIICFFITTLGPYHQAQAYGLLGLPAPGTMFNLGSAYEPVIVKGLTIHKDNPFLFDFIVDVGQDDISGEPLKKEGEKLIKYFLASLAIPDKDVWVNLSPYEKNKMIPDALSQTDMGRDLLEQDYILKQITASLIYPEKQLGKIFWEKVYSKSQQMYGTTQVPVNTFNKVWIMADRAEVFEHNQTAFVIDSHLKVMLEEDYLALSKHQRQPGDMALAVSPSTLPNDSALNVRAPQGNHQPTNSLASQIVKEIILPQLEKEVNTGRNFANLRQIFNSMILASWYKRSLKQALLNQVYADQSKVKGIDLNGATIKEKIYEQYLKAYKKGVFNYIKEDMINGETMPRKYFSGGINEAMAATPQVTSDFAALANALPGKGRLVKFFTAFTDQPAAKTTISDTAMTVKQTAFSEVGAQQSQEIIVDARDFLKIYKRIMQQSRDYHLKDAAKRLLLAFVHENEPHYLFAKVIPNYDGEIESAVNVLESHPLDKKNMSKISWLITNNQYAIGTTRIFSFFKILEPLIYREVIRQAENDTGRKTKRIPMNIGSPGAKVKVPTPVLNPTAFQEEYALSFSWGYAKNIFLKVGSSTQEERKLIVQASINERGTSFFIDDQPIMTSFLSIKKGEELLFGRVRKSGAYVILSSPNKKYPKGQLYYASVDGTRFRHSIRQEADIKITTFMIKLINANGVLLTQNLTNESMDVFVNGFKRILTAQAIETIPNVLFETKVKALPSADNVETNDQPLKTDIVNNNLFGFGQVSPSHQIYTKAFFLTMLRALYQAKPREAHIFINKNIFFLLAKVDAPSIANLSTEEKQAIGAIVREFFVPQSPSIINLEIDQKTVSRKGKNPFIGIITNNNSQTLEQMGKKQDDFFNWVETNIKLIEKNKPTKAYLEESIKYFNMSIFFATRARDGLIKRIEDYTRGKEANDPYLRKYLPYLSKETIQKAIGDMKIQVQKMNKNITKYEYELHKANAVHEAGDFAEWDQAMAAERSAVDRIEPKLRGGIDLNLSNTGMTISKDADGGVQVNFDPATIERIKREGVHSLSPVIFKITPIESIWPLVGLKEPHAV